MAIICHAEGALVRVVGMCSENGLLLSAREEGMMHTRGITTTFATHARNISVTVANPSSNIVPRPCVYIARSACLGERALPATNAFADCAES